ncbi:MAG: hypothetical protein K8R21_10745 [Leptospira sp.]|nr:hypothetical protein [Leptospira sp.]
MLHDSELETYRKWWKRSKSDIQGFHKSYKAETPDGDLLQVDFNYHERLVRLNVQLARERGKSYVATVKQGSIIREKDVTTNRNTSIKGKVHPFRYIFSCIPDDDLLESVGGAYEISRVSLGKQLLAGELPPNDGEPFRTEKKRESFFEYLQRRRQEKIGRDGTFLQRVKRRFWGELHDFLFGSSLGLAVYYHFFDFSILGLSLAIFAFFSGGMDWILRNRNPLMIKVFFFLFTGSYFFYTGYTRY